MCVCVCVCVFINFTGSADIVTLKRMLINVKENVFKLLKKLCLSASEAYLLFFSRTHVYT